jgi:hypothetical protein
MVAARLCCLAATLPLCQSVPAFAVAACCENSCPTGYARIEEDEPCVAAAEALFPNGFHGSDGSVQSWLEALGHRHGEHLPRGCTMEGVGFGGTALFVNNFSYPYMDGRRDCDLDMDTGRNCSGVGTSPSLLCRADPTPAFILGACCSNSCPNGYHRITDKDECAAAAFDLFPDGLMIGDGSIVSWANVTYEHEFKHDLQGCVKQISSLRLNNASHIDLTLNKDCQGDCSKTYDPPQLLCRRDAATTIAI